MLTRVLEQYEPHSILASRSAELRIIVVLLLELINLFNKLLFINNFLIMPRLLILTVPEIAKYHILTFS